MQNSGINFWKASSRQPEVTKSGIMNKPIDTQQFPIIRVICRKGLYTAFHKYVSKYGIAVYVVVEKRLDNGTFFDNHYTNKKDTQDMDNRVR